MADKKPLVSVITPSYNQGHFIEETIQSVLGQDYPQIEYIVIDGGSTDNTLDILKRYQDRLTWVSEKDKGQTDAINKGFKRARGEILAWLNSDDTYLPGAISRVVDYFQAHPDKKSVHGRGYYIGKDSAVIAPYRSDPKAGENLAQAFYICQPTWFIKREVIDQVGSPNPDFHYCMDYEFAVRISREFAIGYLGKYIANIRQYPGNKTSQYKKMQNEVIIFQREAFGQVSFNLAYICCRTAIQAGLNKAEVVSGTPGGWIKLLAAMLTFFKFARLNHKLPFTEFARWVKTNLRISAAHREAQ